MENPLFERIKKRIYRQDLDAVILVGGERGSTKSGCSITIANQLDRDKDGNPRFSLPEKYFPKGFKLKPHERMPRLVFKPTDFLRILSEDNLPRGSAIIWDETGVEADARDFQTKKNKLIKRTLETIRSMNLILFLTAPTIYSYDISLRRSANYYIECQGAIRTSSGKKYGKTRVYEVQTNSRSGKPYFKLLRYSDPISGATTKLERLDIPKPKPFLELPYKRYKKLFQTSLYAEYLKELNSMDSMDSLFDNQGVKKPNFKELVVRALESPSKYFDSHRQRFVSVALMEGLDIESAWTARRVKELLDFKYKRGQIGELVANSV